MSKNFAPRLRLSSLLTAGSFVLLLSGSVILSGCSKHDDKGSDCVFSNSLFLQSHLGAGTNSDASDNGNGDSNVSTEDGVNNGSNPTIALSIPGIGEIPGTDDIPIDFDFDSVGGADLAAALNAVRNGDPQALLNALGGGPSYGGFDLGDLLSRL